MKKLTFAALLFIPWSLVAQTMPQVAPIREQAKTLYRAGQYDESIRLYRQVTRLDPNDVDALKEAMWGFWNMQSYHDASVTASQVKALLPDDPDAKNILSWAPKQDQKREVAGLQKKAIAATQAGRTDEAVGLYRQLTENEPDNVALLHEYMWALWNTNRYEESRKVATHLLQLNPDDTEAENAQERASTLQLQEEFAEVQKRGKAFEDAGLTKEAIESYRKLAKLQPTNVGLLRTLIWALFKDDQIEEAKTVAFELMTLRPHEAASWNTLARMQMAAKQPGDALLSYRKSLEIDPRQPHVQVELAKYDLMERHFDSAIAELKDAQSQDPTLKDLYSLLGKAYFYSDHFVQARDTWAKALEQSPQDVELRFNEGQARFYAGDPDGAITDLKALYASTKNLHALMFVLDDLIARNETRSAEAMLEAVLTDLQPSSEGLAMKLAALYQNDNDDAGLLKILDRFLAVWPDHQPSLSMKASTLYGEKKYEEALELFNELHKVNPYSIGALEGLVSCHQALVHPGEALQSAQLLLKLDPTEPQFIELYADALFSAGYREPAKDAIKKWLKENVGSPVLPVVLYHDLTPFSRDPSLAYPYHDTVAVFEDQMKAIHDGGYTPVTMDEVNQWLAGKFTMPEKPIVIAFDDNRRCSFQFADPILQKYHLKATMFVALVNVDYHHPAAFVSWDELRKYQATGRWEFQSHGDLAHLFVPATPNGGQGLFLVNRKWLVDQNRWETPDEWRSRIAGDHQGAVQKMAQELGREPSAYAWPEGLYGQDGNSNIQEAYPANQHAVLQSFKSAWTQDHIGLNVRTKDPGKMDRVIPNNAWTGAQLINHFHIHDPIVLGYMKLLDWASWTGHTQEAYQWFGELKSHGASDEILYKEEAEIRFAAGDYNGGMALAHRALSFGDDPEIDKMIQQSQMKIGPEWIPSFTYVSDNRERISREFDQTFAIPTSGNLTWRLNHMYGRYSEPGVASVTDNALGAGLDWRLNLVHTISLDGMGHALAGDQHHDQWTASGRMQSQWTDQLSSVIDGGRSLYPTARAFDANLSTRWVQGTLDWTKDLWEATVRGKGTMVSDDNRRELGQAIVARALDNDKTWRLVYRFTFDNTKFVSPDYYSPQQLRLHEFGPEYHVTIDKKIDFYARYLPGVGTERFVSTQFSQDLHTYVRYRWTPATSLMPSFDYQRTPTYNETVYSVEFRHVF